MKPPQTHKRHHRVGLGAWALLVVLLAADSAASAAHDDQPVSWQAVDTAHEQLAFSRERGLLEQLRDTLSNNVQWLWRMARLEFDEAYQMEDKDSRKLPMLRKGLAFARDALKVDDRCAQAHLYYAMLIGQLSYYEGNEAKIRVSHEMKQHGLRAIALDPNSADAQHMMGRWHYELSDLSWVERTLAEALYGKLPDASVEEAIRYFQAARKLEPDNVTHGLWLAKSLLRVDRKEEARKVLEATVKLSPKDRAGREDLAEARKLYEKLQ